jgi:hypothetical protein
VLDHFGRQLILQLPHATLGCSSSVLSVSQTPFNVLSSILSAIGTLAFPDELRT